MKAALSALALAGLACSGLGVVLLGHSQAPRQTFEGKITLPSRNAGPQAAPAALSGAVVSEAAGEPLPGATVTLSRHFENAVLLLLAQEEAALTPIPPVRTNDKGEFSFEGLGATAYDLTVQLEGYMPLKLGASEAGQATYVTLAAGQRISDRKIALTRSAHISGRIRTETGQAMAGIPLRLIRDDSSTPNARLSVEPAAQASSDADGSYSLSGFLPGRYILIAGYPLASNRERAQSFASRIDVPNTELQKRDILLDSKGGYSIRGRLVSNGAPVPNDRRLLIRAVPPGEISQRGGDNMPSHYDLQDGTFEVPALYPGIYQISLGLMDLALQCTVAVVVVSDADVSVDLPLKQCI